MRVTNEFLDAAMANGEWTLYKRTTGDAHRTVNAGELWRQIAEAAWQSADPGVQFDSTINEWHTCPAGGRINASNPCSEYMFLDDTACNLASLNLLAFRKADGAFDVAGFEHAVRLWTLTLEISVLMAQFPSRRIAELSYRYRTLGLGFANVGGYLMASGLPYDSDEGRAFCGAVSALMTGAAYETSADMAAELGPFPGHAENAGAMLRVMRNHRRAAWGETEGYEDLSVRPVPLDKAACPDGALLDAARAAWDRAYEKGATAGYRNAQATVIAPTGTIGLVMDCDTTGIEPDFALVKFKKLAGGGYFKIINRLAPLALRTLGYATPQIEEMIRYAVGNGSLEESPAIDHAALRRAGFTEAMIERGRGRPRPGLRHQVRLQQVDPGRGFLRQPARPRPGRARRSGIRHARRPRLHAPRDRGRQRLGVRGDDPGRRAAPEGRASAGVRLRLAVRAHRQALPELGEPYPHDGGGPALRLRRDLQDDQHAQRGDGRGLPQGL